MRIFPCGRFSFFALRCAFVVSPGGLKRYTGRKGRERHVAQV
nr:MAG TPA: hypothetical protein [Caudoviricetes sp.]